MCSHVQTFRPETGAPGGASPTVVRHERREGRKGLEVYNCSTDEGRSLGIGLQERVPNHLRRLWSKAMVVSTEGKGLERTKSGGWQEEDRKGTTDDVSKAYERCQNRRGSLLREQLRRRLHTDGAASGIKVA